MNNLTISSNANYSIEFVYKQNNETGKKEVINKIINGKNKIYPEMLTVLGFCSTKTKINKLMHYLGDVKIESQRKESISDSIDRFIFNFSVEGIWRYYPTRLDLNKKITKSFNFFTETFRTIHELEIADEVVEMLNDPSTSYYIKLKYELIIETPRIVSSFTSGERTINYEVYFDPDLTNEIGSKVIPTVTDSNFIASSSFVNPAYIKSGFTGFSDDNGQQILNLSYKLSDDAQLVVYYRFTEPVFILNETDRVVDFSGLNIKLENKKK